MIQSTDSFVKKMFPASATKKNGGSKKLALISISGKFKVCNKILTVAALNCLVSQTQLNELMNKLKETVSICIVHSNE